MDQGEESLSSETSFIEVLETSPIHLIHSRYAQTSANNGDEFFYGQVRVLQCVCGSTDKSNYLRCSESEKLYANTLVPVRENEVDIISTPPKISLPRVWKYLTELIDNCGNDSESPRLRK
jgi:hypothetical protein